MKHFMSEAIPFCRDLYCCIDLGKKQILVMGFSSSTDISAGWGNYANLVVTANKAISSANAAESNKNHYGHDLKGILWELNFSKLYYIIYFYYCIYLMYFCGRVYLSCFNCIPTEFSCRDYNKKNGF